MYPIKPPLGASTGLCRRLVWTSKWLLRGAHVKLQFCATRWGREQTSLWTWWWSRAKVARAPNNHPLHMAAFIPGTWQPITDKYVRRVGRPRREWVFRSQNKNLSMYRWSPGSVQTSAKPTDLSLHGVPAFICPRAARRMTLNEKKWVGFTCSASIGHSLVSISWKNGTFFLP